MNMMTKMITGMIAIVVIAAHLTQAQTTTYTGPNGAYNNDTWNNDANWDSGTGTVPSNTVNVIVETGRIPWSVNDTPAYTGSLTLQTNAGLGLLDASHNALGTGPITMEAGSQIIMRTATYTFNQAFVLAGDAKIFLSSSTAGHNATRTFASGFSGAYALALDGQNGNVANLDTSNAFTNLTASVNGSTNWKVVGGAEGSLGTGAVTINNAVNLVVGALGAMTNVTALFLNGARSTKVAGENKLVMNANDSVPLLTIDGFAYPTGTYSRVGLGTADHEVSWISGDSVLTVLDAPEDTTPPELLSMNAGGASHIYLDLQTNLTYAIEFNEPIDAATVGVDDFENAGTAPVTIDSVAQTTPTRFNVAVSPTGLGTLTLRVKASLDDLFGNTLAAPVTDDHTVSVEASAPTFNLIYEPFADANSTLTGNTPGLGLLGTWVANASVRQGTISFGNYPATANEAVFDNQYGGVAVDVSRLTAKSLLDDGASLWFSLLLKTGNDIATNGDLGFAFGTERIGSGNNIPIANSGIALGVRFKNNQLRAAAWTPTLVFSGGSSVAGETVVLVAGRFIWGSTNDTVELYNVAEDLTIGEVPDSTYTTAANFDQSAFDTISIGCKTSSPAHIFREIRFGATFDEVMGIAPPPAGTVLIIK